MGLVETRDIDGHVFALRVEAGGPRNRSVAASYSLAKASIEGPSASSSTERLLIAKRLLQNTDIVRALVPPGEVAPARRSRRRQRRWQEAQ